MSALLPFSRRTALPWPLAVIDFEASSLDQDSYPIEVGVALWPASHEPVLGWSALIRPAEDWTRRGHWNSASAEVHGIRRSDLLVHGRLPAWLAAALNAALGLGGVAWFDDGSYDAHWARTLFKVGGVRPLFVLDDWHRLAAMLGPTERERALAWLEQAPACHRVRADVEQLLLALAHAAKVEVGLVQDFAQRLPALVALAMPNKGAPQRGVAS